MMGIVLLSIVVVALVMLTMAVGLLFSRPCLRGSCGALAGQRFDDESLDCDACPLRLPKARPPSPGVVTGITRRPGI